MSWVLKLSFKYLFAKRREKFISLISLLSVGGCAISVMTLVVVLAVMNGFDRDLKRKILGTHAHINIVSEEIVEDYQEMGDEILKNEGITSFAPFIFGQVMTEVRGKTYGFFLRGINVEQEKNVTDIARYITQGTLPVDDESIVVGIEIAKNLNLEIGDNIKVMSAVPDVAALGLGPSAINLKVCGIFASGMYQYDSGMIYTDLEPAQVLFGLGDGVHGISIRIDDIKKTAAIKKALMKAFNYPYVVKTWIDMNRNLFAALKTEKSVMTILLFLAILVSSTNIVSTLVMIVMEKTKDIGVIRSLGADSKSIMTVFVVKGFLIGIFGTIIGVSLGLSFVWWLEPIREFVSSLTGFDVFPSDIYYFEKIPVWLKIGDNIFIAAGAVVISTVAAFYPAYKAVKLKPVEALRYE